MELIHRETGDPAFKSRLEHAFDTGEILTVDLLYGETRAASARSAASSCPAATTACGAAGSCAVGCSTASIPARISGVRRTRGRRRAPRQAHAARR